MSKKSSGKVTVANIVSLLGLVGLAFLVFCGYALQNPNGNIGVSIIVSVGLTAFVGFLLWLMIYAKGAENDFTGWRVVEITTGIVFLGTAFWAGSIMMHFFVVSDNMETLKNSALNDIKIIEEGIRLFKDQERERVQINKTGLLNAIGTKGCDESVEEYFEKNNISKNESSIAHWSELKEQEIEDITWKDKTYNEAWNKNMKKIKLTIEEWNLFLLPYAAASITQMAETASELLTDISKNSDIVKIQLEKTSYGIRKYTVVESDAYEYKMEVSFSDKVKKESGFSVTGLLLIIFVNGLLLFNYIFAYRTHKVRPKNGKNMIDGIPLS